MECVVNLLLPVLRRSDRIGVNEYSIRAEVTGQTVRQAAGNLPTVFTSIADEHFRYSTGPLGISKERTIQTARGRLLTTPYSLIVTQQ